MLGLYISTLSDLKRNSIESRLGETSGAVQHRIDFEAAARRRRAPGHVAAWETTNKPRPFQWPKPSRDPAEETTLTHGVWNEGWRGQAVKSTSKSQVATKGWRC